MGASVVVDKQRQIGRQVDNLLTERNLRDEVVSFVELVDDTFVQNPLVFVWLLLCPLGENGLREMPLPRVSLKDHYIFQAVFLIVDQSDIEPKVVADFENPVGLNQWCRVDEGEPVKDLVGSPVAFWDDSIVEEEVANGDEDGNDNERHHH